MADKVGPEVLGFPRLQRDTGNGTFAIPVSIEAGGGGAGPVVTPTDGGATQAGQSVNSQNEVYNGTTWDLMREANAAAGTPGVGLLGVGIEGYDGANWQRAAINSAGALLQQLDHSTPGLTDRVAARISAYRNPGILHRSAVTAPDKVLTPAAPTSADVATGGSLVFATTYNFAVAAGTRWGPTAPSPIASQLTANDAASTHVVRLTIAQSVGATVYDLFLAQAAAPLWVARITEAQRAAGVTITAVGTVSATSPGAGKVDIRIPGTGLATTATPFTINNAYLPANATPIDCTGYQTVTIFAKLTVTDLRILPGLALATFQAPQLSPTDWFEGTVFNLNALSQLRTPLEQLFTFNVLGSTSFIVLIDTIAGQGGSCDVWVELA